ncbi:tripartite tricarboxylate transporter substrate binding protein [Orrella sp. JC864]|uniref:Bug family tripartite tricarboxylate transporter substrate binding protein n=1 Tax=Orrella sp. JC864 TaxID=3120298 RepID=UPI0012BD4292
MSFSLRSCGMRAAGALLAAGLALGAAPAALAAYPDKPIRMIVPYPPGGATDVIGRVLGQALGESLGQTIVVENRGGAAGNIGAAAVATSAPDGYTLLMGALTSHSINSALYGQQVSYDLEKSFAPIAIVGRVPLVFVVNKSVPAQNLKELIDLAKSKPGELTYASAGNGSPQHMAGELFKVTAGVDMLHVPYRGSGPAMTDLIGGQVLTMIETVPAAQPHILGDKLRALAVASPQRVTTLPDVPTAAEAGLADFEVSSMFGIMAPAGTPAEAVEKLSAALKDILARPAIQDALLKQGAIAEYKSPEDTGKEVATEVAKWKALIEKANIKPE